MTAAKEADIKDCKTLGGSRCCLCLCCKIPESHNCVWLSHTITMSCLARHCILTWSPNQYCQHHLKRILDACQTEQYLYKLSWSVARKVRYEIMTINVLNFSHIPHKANITQQEISRDEHITIIKQPSKHIRSQFDSIRIFFEWYVLWNKTLQVEFWRTVVLEARFSWVFHFLDRPTCFEEDLHQQAQGQGFWTSRGI